MMYNVLAVPGDSDTLRISSLVLTGYTKENFDIIIVIDTLA